ncbi:MAG: FlgD immunoglobulin-like domain containing protein [Elusimicrobiota bacterium]
MRSVLHRGRFALAALATAICLSRAASAAPAFTPEERVLFSSMVVQAVVPSTSGYRMYMTSDSVRVLSASSTDQINWSLETGIRLSTAPDHLDSSSITALGVLPSTNSADGYRMYYVALSSGGLYSLLSATSTDGLSWGKEAGYRLRANGGAGFLDSPQPLSVSGTLMRLFYVADNAGGNDPSNYRVFAATSSDGGLSLDETGSVLSAQAYQVSVTTLTDGRTRLYYSAPLTGETTASQVLSAISDDGETFTVEDGVRLSTTSSLAALTYPRVIRTTETFRWRMFSNYTLSGSTEPYVSSALTLTPVVDSLAPALVLNSQTAVPFTLSGEIFSPSPTVTFTQGAATFTATGVARPSDLQITGTMDPSTRSTGNWHVVVTNADGMGGLRSNGLYIDIPPGNVTITDNLFRPLRGQSAKIAIEIFEIGNVTVRLYTVAGGLVATLYDGPMPTGTTLVTWAGTTSLGNTVASGVYLLSVRGPKIDTVKKIVVIK